MTGIIEATFRDAPRYAAVFGSAATGAMREESDIDVFLERARGAEPGRFEVDADSLAWQVTRLTGNEVRPLVYGEEEVAGAMASQPVLAEIARDGITVAGDAAAFRARLRRGVVRRTPMPRVERAPGVLQGRASKLAQFAEATEIIVELADDDELRDGVVTLAVHAGIAAADVICLRRLGWYGQSANHVDAVGCLRQADARAANHLATPLQLKT